MSRVFVTGATGFVGHALVGALRARGHIVRCLVRRGSEPHLRGMSAVERVEGDVLTRAGLAEEMGGCSALVHLVGIIREAPAAGITFERLHVDATENVLAAAVAAGLPRIVHTSALGAGPGARARYYRSKWAAEELVRGSGLRWTIFRPSLVYGRGDHLVSLLACMVRRLPAVPVVGTGQQRLQPVAVEHVAEAMARALEMPQTEKQAYEVGGPDVVSALEIIALVGELLGRRRVRAVRVAPGLLHPLARALHRLPGFPVSPDQLAMLEEDAVCDPRPFHEAFGLTPLPLREGLRRMLET